MAESKKKSEAAAPKKAAVPAKQSDIVSVKNTSDEVVNTSKGAIKSGETGEATIAELRSYSHYLAKI